MLKQNTAKEIYKIFRDAEGYGVLVQAVDRRTGKIQAEPVKLSDPIDTSRFRYAPARIVVEGNYIDVAGDVLRLSDVHFLLGLVAKAKRTHKKIVIECDAPENPLAIKYGIYANPNGSIKVGCQEFTAEEVEFVAANIPKR